MSLISDVPPLEDMSELINQVDALRELKKQQGNTSGVSTCTIIVDETILTSGQT